ncbi:hypothetical protein [Burkholderia contaminans]|uniref:hypothetical protein n=1 Tax=Burkholderia contaminans TaxID=488447 RepID=UPI001454A53D|nr:hypothetical protein [Burkholderia contaminans]VWD22329.1 hypothetical protein BCO18442_04013 [Burkholderia contaminans]
MSGNSQLGPDGWVAPGVPRTDLSAIAIPFFIGQPPDGVGRTRDLSVDPSSLTIYRNTDGKWSPVGASGDVTVRNANGTVTRTLTMVGGVATLAAADAIVTQGQALALQNSAGVAQAGVGQTAVVANGVMTASRLTNSTVAVIKNGDTMPLQTSAGAVSSGNATLNSPAKAVVANGAITAVRASE